MRTAMSRLAVADRKSAIAVPPCRAQKHRIDVSTASKHCLTGGRIKRPQPRIAEGGFVTYQHSESIGGVGMPPGLKCEVRSTPSSANKRALSMALRRSRTLPGQDGFSRKVNAAGEADRVARLSGRTNLSDQSHFTRVFNAQMGGRHVATDTETADSIVKGMAWISADVLFGLMTPLEHAIGVEPGTRPKPSLLHTHDAAVRSKEDSEPVSAGTDKTQTFARLKLSVFFLV